jgi:hypothetical protein
MFIIAVATRNILPHTLTVVPPPIHSLAEVGRQYRSARCTRRDLYSLRLRFAPVPLKKGKEGRFGLKFVTSPFGLGVE